MSTYDDKQLERLRTTTGKSLGPSLGPLEVAALWVAQLYGTFVWLVVLAGLGGFRPEFVPAVTASWAAASAQWAALAAFSPLLAAWTPNQRIERA